MSEKEFPFTLHRATQGADGKVRFETRRGFQREAGPYADLSEAIYTEMRFETVWEPPPKPHGVAFRDPFAGGVHDGPTLDGVPYRAR